VGIKVAVGDAVGVQLGVGEIVGAAGISVGFIPHEDRERIIKIPNKENTFFIKYLTRINWCFNKLNSRISHRVHRERRVFLRGLCVLCGYRALVQKINDQLAGS
jgi:hypothetical protein